MCYGTTEGAGEGCKPRPTQPNRSAKLLIIQAINLHPLNLAAPSPSPSGCSNGGTSGHRRLIFFPLPFFLVFHCIYLLSKMTGRILSTDICMLSVSVVCSWENLRRLRCTCQNVGICIRFGWCVSRLVSASKLRPDCCHSYWKWATVGGK